VIRTALLAVALALVQIKAFAATPQWLIASPEVRATAGERFELVVVAPREEALPDEIDVRIRTEADERIVPLTAAAPAANGRRSYVGTMPPGLSGAVTLELAGRSSSVLVLTVAAKSDVVQRLIGAPGTSQYEPPISENDPMYFAVGSRGGWTARFQLSFKYRLFDIGTGFGRERPWLSGLYFGYTQNSLWDLSSESRPFRDTSYLPSIFWKWEREDEKAFIDRMRLGLEHESNGTGGPRSRSINILFVRPEWHKGFANGHQLQFTPKLYGYLDRTDNPDIEQYRGYVDWRLRYDANAEWIATGVARRGTSGKGSVLFDLSRRSRDLRFGPVGGYFHFQYFAGYGEDILDYNVRRKAQIRFGFAIVP